MKICLVQMKPLKGEVGRNIDACKRFIARAAERSADFVFFPELSLTSYEPTLAADLACEIGDSLLDIFQEMSDALSISIAVSLPIKSDRGLHISLVIFQPNQPRVAYSKQMLHPDEKAYFTEGRSQVVIETKKIKIAPAICFESLQSSHIEQAVCLGADAYIASVAKPQRGVEKALRYFSEKSRQYSMPILMSNAVGYCDNFESAGQSAVWDRSGQILAQLGKRNEGLVFYDVDTNDVAVEVVSKQDICNNDSPS